MITFTLLTIYHGVTLVHGWWETFILNFELELILINFDLDYLMRISSYKLWMKRDFRYNFLLKLFKFIQTDSIMHNNFAVAVQTLL